MRKVMIGMRCNRNNKAFSPGIFAIVFGLGLILSSFCPPGLMYFIVACIIVGLGVALLRCRT